MSVTYPFIRRYRKSDHTNSSHIRDALQSTYIENVKSDSCLNLSHQLTDIQSNLLDEVKDKETFPSFQKSGFGKTCLEQHLITVVYDNLPVKRKHYPISPAIQQLLYSQLVC